MCICLPSQSPATACHPSCLGFHISDMHCRQSRQAIVSRSGGILELVAIFFQYTRSTSKASPQFGQITETFFDLSVPCSPKSRLRPYQKSASSSRSTYSLQCGQSQYSDMLHCASVFVLMSSPFLACVSILRTSDLVIQFCRTIRQRAGSGGSVHKKPILHSVCNQHTVCHLIQLYRRLVSIRRSCLHLSWCFDGTSNDNDALISLSLIYHASCPCDNQPPRLLRHTCAERHRRWCQLESIGRKRSGSFPDGKSGSLRLRIGMGRGIVAWLGSCLAIG